MPNLSHHHLEKHADAHYLDAAAGRAHTSTDDHEDQENLLRQRGEIVGSDVLGRKAGRGDDRHNLKQGIPNGVQDVVEAEPHPVVPRHKQRGAREHPPPEPRLHVVPERAKVPGQDPVMDEEVHPAEQHHEGKGCFNGGEVSISCLAIVVNARVVGRVASR